MERIKVSVVIPVHNEEASLGTVLEGINRVKGKDWEVIVVDDGSEDGSATIARKKGAKVLSHPYCIGNGAAVKTGIRKAKGEIVVLMDGDGQHNPEEIPGLLEEIRRYDMVVGVRDWNSQADSLRGFGNKVYNLLASYVTGRRIPDLTSGFRAVRRKVLSRYLYLFPNTFSYPATLTLAMIRSGHSVAFVPIKTGKRKGRSKLNPLKDGVRFFLIIAKIATLFSPFRIFLPISGILFVSGVLYYLYWFFTARRFTNMALLLILLSVIVFLMGLISEQINQLRYERTEERD